jgi:DNA-binding MarR family transcriptional regulator
VILTQSDQLLSALASIRASGRLLALRPAELSTLTGSQLDLVRLVLHHPGISVAQAARQLRLAPNTVSTLVRQLTDVHMLIRRIDQSDRRVARLYLTPAMRRKVSAFLDRRVAALADVMRQFSVSERRRLTDALPVLEHLAERLHEESTDDGSPLK